jgi:hypothetical protein
MMQRPTKPPSLAVFFVKSGDYHEEMQVSVIEKG